MSKHLRRFGVVGMWKQENRSKHQQVRTSLKLGYPSAMKDEVVPDRTADAEASEDGKTTRRICAQ